MPDRLQRKRTAGWRMPPGAVYVGRPTIWGNPWRVGNPGTVEPPPHLDLAPTVYRAHERWDAAGVTQFHRWWLAGYALTAPYSPWRATMNRQGQRLVWDAFAARRSLILSRLPELRGRDLVCWCPPGCACHADLLMELANA